MAKKQSYKDKNGTTRVGDFLRKIGKSNILEKAVGVVGNVASGNYLGAIQTIFSKEPDATPEQIAELNRLVELDYKDLENARDLQKAALAQDDLFSKRFIYYLTIGVFAFSVAVVLLLFWVEIPEKNRDVINFILGVVVGTGLTGIFNYFFGSSKGSSDKMSHIFNGKNNN